MVRTSSYLHAKFGGDPPLHGGVRNKSLVFLFFVCLFVTLWILIRGLVIQIAILSPFVGESGHFVRTISLRRYEILMQLFMLLYSGRNAVVHPCNFFDVFPVVGRRGHRVSQCVFS